jgi:hypothetical protein
MTTIQLIILGYYALNILLLPKAVYDGSVEVTPTGATISLVVWSGLIYWVASQ